jgi:hypothetical protein
MRLVSSKRMNKRKEASAKLDQIRLRAKPVSEEELLSWIKEGRER